MKTSVSGDLTIIVESSGEWAVMCRQRMIIVSASSCVQLSSSITSDIVSIPLELAGRCSASDKQTEASY